MDEFCRRDIKRIARYPGAALPIVELDAQRQQHVTGATGLICRVTAIAADESIMADASAVDKLVEPGPQEVKVATG